MSEATVTETTVAAIVAQPHNQAKAEPRGAAADAVVVTNDNKAEFDDKILGTPKAEPIADTPEAKAAEELKAVEKEKAERAAKDKTEEIDHPDAKKKGKLQERFGELTQARKDAEAKALAAEVKAQAAERAAAELKAKYEPVRTDELGPEPRPEQFVDPVEFGKALKDWTTESVRREDAAKARAEEQTKAVQTAAAEFKAREEAHRKASPEYDKKLADSPVTLSDQMAHEIRMSDVGPQILEHLADNPEVALSIGKMNIGQMLKAFGRLEATLQKSAPKAEPATVTPIRKDVEISRAPAPIEPLSSGDGGVVRLSGSQEVPKSMDYEQWKALRKSGKIK